MKIFPDFIDDKVFPKANKKFTTEEKILIDKFIESLYKNFKHLELEDSSTDLFYDDPRFFTELISKSFKYKKKKNLTINFYKIYCKEKKFWFRSWIQPKKGPLIDCLTVGMSSREGSIGSYSGHDVYHGVFKVDVEEEGGFEEFKKNNKLVAGMWCLIYLEGYRLLGGSAFSEYEGRGGLKKKYKEKYTKIYFPNILKQLKAKIK